MNFKRAAEFLKPVERILDRARLDQKIDGYNIYTQNLVALTVSDTESGVSEYHYSEERIRINYWKNTSSRPNQVNITVEPNELDLKMAAEGLRTLFRKNQSFPKKQ